MKKHLVATALAAAVALVPFASPASANTGAAIRNIFLLGAAAAAAIGLTNYNHKKHLREEQETETDRRQASYKAYYYRKNGTYPTPEQVHEWYVKTYGAQPAT
ncbi:MAG: hypothetical protein IAI49_08065 [Candidatus Eremiobacteraeota bacterium]|nr:hypothetical protein [Candidatus Eremiobacteraeota bacterium]